MYQDWKQWGRAVFALLTLLLVSWLIDAKQLVQLANWQFMNDLPEWLGWLQVSLFTIAAGLIFPKAKHFEEWGSDWYQFMIGGFVWGIALFMSLWR
ncbi:hypothetical protein [Thiothrix fructosivorans]|uniref:Uncharacterized protein n=1 Tax=Thiothrix fructosivorans TaxID=111770 RepID=A0A8B0SKJ1_9GAMM|nr:hypothetical protein [Thiothrix fructosivorans]MBO0611776.1 hypothetical protein [Thiothrix fructosivorans]QTX10568.1 hypothetical protein J1836_018685 [Thiothrix fructosivorans]